MSTEVTTVEEVWRELHERLLAFIARRVRTREDAEDILQEVMLRIHRHNGGIEHADRVTAWVYRIATNAIADHYRSPARRELPSGQSGDVPEPAGEPAQTAWTKPDAAEVRSEL